MSENTVPDITTLPKKFHFNKTIAIRVAVAATAVAVIAVVVVKLNVPSEAVVEIVETVVES